MEHIHKEILGLMGKVDIDCPEEGDIIIVELSGQLDIYNSGDLQKLIDAYIVRGFDKFAIDLRNVTYLDSSAISIFIACHQCLNKSEGRFMLVGLNGLPLRMFEMAKLNDVLECHHNLHSAVQSTI